MNLLLWLALAAPGVSLAPRSVDPEPSALSVFAAASLTEAFRDLARTLEHNHPGLAVLFNFAGSQQLAFQIEQGAPADVFASADQRWMDYAKQKGLVQGKTQVFAVIKSTEVMIAKGTGA